MNERNDLTASSKAKAPSSSSPRALTWLVEHASIAEHIKMVGDGITFSPRLMIVDCGEELPMMTEIILEMATMGAAAKDA